MLPGSYFVVLALLVLSGTNLSACTRTDCSLCHNAAGGDFGCKQKANHQNNLHGRGIQDFLDFFHRPACPLKMREEAGRKVRVVTYQLDTGDDTLPVYETDNGTFLASDIEWLVSKGFVRLDKPTLIYMGGFNQKIDTHWLMKVRENYRLLASARGGVAPANLVFFDWNPYQICYPLCYGPTVRYVEHLGVVLRNFVEQLITIYRYKADQVHFISHSLSTHMAGLAGRKLEEAGLGRVAQITAIDPTGVCFHNRDEFDKLFSLRGTDAKLVVSTHYNMDGLGSKRPVGGVDVLVNGGKEQPEMAEQFQSFYSFDEKVMVFAGLGDHLFATTHATYEQIATDCQQVAYECDSIESFRLGHCASCGRQNTACMLLGEMANLRLGLNPVSNNYELGTKMFITTGFDSFCVHHYQVVAELKPGANQAAINRFLNGEIEYEIDTAIKVRPMNRLDDDSSTAAIRFTELLLLDSNELRFRKQIVEDSQEMLESIKAISINYMSNISPEERAKRSARYCPHRTVRAALVLCSKGEDV